jgi:hypothetical protein
VRVYVYSVYVYMCVCIRVCTYVYAGAYACMYRLDQSMLCSISSRMHVRIWTRPFDDCHACGYSCVSMHMRVCMCMLACMHVYVRMYVYVTHEYVCTCVYTLDRSMVSSNVCVHVRVCLSVCTSMHMGTRVYMHICIRVSLYARVSPNPYDG